MSPKPAKLIKCVNCCYVVEKWCMSHGDPFCEKCYAVIMIEESLRREVKRIRERFPKLDLEYVLLGMGHVSEHIST